MNVGIISGGKGFTVRKAAVIVVAVMGSAFAFSQQVMMLSEIVSSMSTNDYRCNFALTNSLNQIALSTTGLLERSTCNLLSASILLDHAENMADSNSFAQATNLCCIIEDNLSGLIVWQRIGSLCIFANAMVDDGHPEIAFVASTNLLNSLHGNQCLDVDTNVWNVIFKSGGLDIMPPVSFINASAAMSLFRMNPHADLSIYTNGLPQEILREILKGE